MIEILENHYNSLETKRADLFEILNRYTANELNTSVVQGKWSPLQIVEHLSKAEHLSVIYVSKKKKKSIEEKNQSCFYMNFQYIVSQFWLPFITFMYKSCNNF